MWICVCQQINDKKLLNILENNGNSVKSAVRELCVGKQCGGCIKYAHDYLTKAKESGNVIAS